MTGSERFTDPRVPDTGLRALFRLENRWQAWLHVEAALAMSEAELGIVPRASAERIAEVASLDQLDEARIRSEIERASHPLMPLILELTRVAGEPHGGWVHWGATTQNITQTGDLLVLEAAHRTILRLLSSILAALSDLAERGADLVMAGRTHGQHAVPITFGFKVAVWIDELTRHVTRLQQTEPRLFVAMTGGAVGTFASLGPRGPEVQARVAHRLGMAPMKVPARSIGDHMAEYVCVLALLAATCGKIGREVFLLMEPEFGEVEETAPDGTIGSSTMPHKRNPQLSQDIIAISAEIRSLVPFALESMGQEHEADGAASAMMFEALSRACILTGDLLARLQLVLGGLALDGARMRANLDLTGGLIMSESVMLALGARIGRQHAHDVVYEATRVNDGRTFAQVLAADPRVTAHLDRGAIDALLDPSTHIGLSAEIAHRAASGAQTLVEQIEAEYAGSTSTQCPEDTHFPPSCSN